MNERGTEIYSFCPIIRLTSPFLRQAEVLTTSVTCIYIWTWFFECNADSITCGISLNLDATSTYLTPQDPGPQFQDSMTD